MWNSGWKRNDNRLLNSNDEKPELIQAADLICSEQEKQYKSFLKPLDADLH